MSLDLGPNLVEQLGEVLLLPKGATLPGMDVRKVDDRNNAFDIIAQFQEFLNGAEYLLPSRRLEAKPGLDLILSSTNP